VLSSSSSSSFYLNQATWPINVNKRHTDRQIDSISKRKKKCNTRCTIKYGRPKLIKMQTDTHWSSFTISLLCLTQTIKVLTGSSAVMSTFMFTADVDTDRLSLASCPLLDAYHFSYINNSGGACIYPASYVKPCASPSRLRFYFRECPSAAYTHEHGKHVFTRLYSSWKRMAVSTSNAARTSFLGSSILDNISRSLGHI